jgi:hypothetical protein
MVYYYHKGDGSMGWLEKLEDLLDPCQHCPLALEQRTDQECRACRSAMQTFKFPGYDPINGAIPFM